MNRQKLALVILLAIFAVAIASSFLRQPRQKTVEKLKYTTGMAADVSRAAGKVSYEKKLRLDLLDKDLPPFSGFKRNIFRPLFPAEMKPSLLSMKLGKPALPIPPPRPPLPPPVELTPAQKAMEDVAQFTFLGFLQKENHRKIIFLSRDNEIILVRKGDIIAGKYEVASITDEALSINLLATGEQIIVPLMENRPLRRL
jgi:hypothetical protein